MTRSRYAYPPIKFIFNGKGEMVGSLHSGKSKTGTTAACVTYATPAWRLLECDLALQICVTVTVTLRSLA